MKFGPLISIVGATGLLSLASFHTVQAQVTISAPAAAADQQDSSTPRTIELPEPASWTMLILGFAAIGAAVRHGRTQRLRNDSIRQAITSGLQEGYR